RKASGESTYKKKKKKNVETNEEKWLLILDIMKD
ncbi:unnamed protein product, partial [marine sediment metagenome]